MPIPGPVFVVLAVLQLVSGHSYHYGQCPHVPAMRDFDMSRFAGKWYVLEKTSTSVRCLENNFSPKQLAQTMILGIPGINNVVRYEGQILTPDPYLPASMEVKFPLNVAGRSSYIVIDTDYDNYAATYSCQKLAFWYRHSASILSRSSNLDASIIQQLHQRLKYLGVDPGKLQVIKQNCPPFPEDGIQVNIKPNVFKPTNVTEVLGTARDVVNDVADIGKTAYEVYNVVNQVTGGERRRRDVEEDDVGIPDWLP